LNTENPNPDANDTPVTENPNPGTGTGTLPPIEEVSESISSSDSSSDEIIDGDSDLVHSHSSDSSDDHHHHHHHSQVGKPPRPINRFTEYPKINGLYFDKVRESVIRIKRGSPDSLDFIVTNQTYQESNVGMFITPRVIRIRYPAGEAEALLRVDSSNHVSSIMWRLNATQLDSNNVWTLASKKLYAKDPNDYCQLVSAKEKVQPTSLFGWSTIQDKALYYDKRQPGQSYDGTSTGADWYVYTAPPASTTTGTTTTTTTVADTTTTTVV